VIVPDIVRESYHIVFDNTVQLEPVFFNAFANKRHNNKKIIQYIENVLICNQQGCEYTAYDNGIQSIRGITLSKLPLSLASHIIVPTIKDTGNTVYGIDPFVGLFFVPSVVMMPILQKYTNNEWFTVYEMEAYNIKGALNYTELIDLVLNVEKYVDINLLIKNSITVTVYDVLYYLYYIFWHQPLIILHLWHDNKFYEILLSVYDVVNLYLLHYMPYYRYVIEHNDKFWYFVSDENNIAIYHNNKQWGNFNINSKSKSGYDMLTHLAPIYMLWAKYESQVLQLLLSLKTANVFY